MREGAQSRLAFESVSELTVLLLRSPSYFSFESLSKEMDSHKTRATCYVLVLGAGCYVLRATCSVLRAACYVLMCYVPLHGIRK